MLLWFFKGDFQVITPFFSNHKERTMQSKTKEDMCSSLFRKKHINIIITLYFLSNEVTKTCDIIYIAWLTPGNKTLNIYTYHLYMQYKIFHIYFIHTYKESKKYWKVAP